MKAATKRCLLVAAGSLLLVACPSSVEQGQPEGGLKDASPAQPVGCLDASDTTGPCPVAIGCDGGWTTYSSIAAPAWLAGRLDACVEHPTHSPPQLYDDCPVVMRSSCDYPERNAVYCHGNHLAATCRVSADCPAGWVCANQSQCEKACTGATPNECGRCDLACHPTLHYCSIPVPAPVPCISDCQCPGRGCELSTGFCSTALGGIPRLEDSCDPTPPPFPGACACRGGTCREDRCCVLANGSIANAFSPECAPQ